MSADLVDDWNVATAHMARTARTLTSLRLSGAAKELIDAEAAQLRSLERLVTHLARRLAAEIRPVRHGEGGNCEEHGSYCGQCNDSCPECDEAAGTEVDQRIEEAKERSE